MRGSIYKRCTCPARTDARGRRLTCAKPHGSWSYKLDLPAGPGSPRKQLGKGGFKTKKDAEDALATAVTAAGRGENLQPSKRSLNDYVATWLATVRPALSVSAYGNYDKTLHFYVLPRLGHTPLRDLTGHALSTLYVQLLERGGRGGRPLSPTTVRTVHRVLHKCLGDAVETGLLASNPVQRARPPKRVKADTRVWSEEEAAKFLLHVRGDRLYVAWLLALSCGLRRGELAGLRWRDLDLEKATLSVTTQRTTDADGRVVTKEPKGTSRRTLDLGTGTVEALRRHRLAQRVEGLQLGLLLTRGDVAGDAGGDGGGATDHARDFVLTMEDGEPYHPQFLTINFQRAVRAAGVPAIRLHDARHSCATLAFAAGIHPKVVQQLLGHASWSTTMDLYSHRVDRLQREASQRIEHLLLPPAPIPEVG
jgi:integrase